MNALVSMVLVWLRRWLSRLYAFLDLPPIEEIAPCREPRARDEPARARGSSGKILEFRARAQGDTRAGRSDEQRRVLLVQTARYYDDS